MAHWLSTFAQTVYREYDRRIRRASLVTEYGALHGAAHDADEAHADDGDIVIANVPRGAAVAPRDETHTTSATVADRPHAAAEVNTAAPVVPAPAAARERPALPPAVSGAQQDSDGTAAEIEAENVNTPPGTAVTPPDDEAEIVNTPPGTPAKR